MKRKAILLTLVLSLLLVSAVLAGSSANYALDWIIPLTSGGGGPAASTSYAVNYSVGQTVIGDMASTNYGVHLGFWQEFTQSIQNLFIWMPVITK
jgi:hypothetical protein